MKLSATALCRRSIIAERPRQSEAATTQTFLELALHYLCSNKTCDPAASCGEFCKLKILDDGVFRNFVYGTTFCWWLS